MVDMIEGEGSMSILAKWFSKLQSLRAMAVQSTCLSKTCHADIG
jgi:hypothetical protein